MLTFTSIFPKFIFKAKFYALVKFPYLKKEKHELGKNGEGIKKDKLVITKKVTSVRYSLGNTIIVNIREYYNNYVWGQVDRSNNRQNTL